MDWNEIRWKSVDTFVTDLQRRIYKATKEGRNSEGLQTLMINSWYCKLKAVRRVTVENRGKKTPGVDGVKSLPPSQRYQLCQSLRIDGKAEVIRRVYIPKNLTEKRPLGIPTIEDRAKQAMVFMALEPQWEAFFEPNSYGFRPGRSCHDAIEAIFTSIAKKNKYVLDGDIRKWFDSINHEALLAKLQSPREIKLQIESWLKAGIMEGDEIFPTTEGTPQGGIISPLLANIALHGMEGVLKDFVSTIPVGKLGRMAKMQRLSVIRYADDFVVIHPEKEVILTCQKILEEWLRPLGLELNLEKTRLISPLELGGKFEFDFLGFTIRQRHIGKYRIKNSKIKLPFVTHISPSHKSIKKHKKSLSECFKSQTVQGLLPLLNSKIRGWAEYFKIGVSKKIFGDIDAWLYQRFMLWAQRKHPQRGKIWLVENYFRQTNPGRWIFGIKLQAKGKVSNLCQVFHRDTPIKRHIKVSGSRSPYDGNWAYWSSRMSKYGMVSLPPKVSFLLKRQKGRCPACNLYFFPSDRPQIDHIIPRSKGGGEDYKNLQLLHIHCHVEKSRKD